MQEHNSKIFNKSVLSGIMYSRHISDKLMVRQTFSFFQRGRLYINDGANGKDTSGLLFICFQADIERGSDYIKKNLLTNENFPVPERRNNFNFVERQQGLSTFSE